MSIEDTKPTFEVPFGNYTATFEKGVWSYKPIEKAIETKTVTANPKYKDPVQFKIMEEYEGKAESNYQTQLAKMAHEIVGYLKTA